MVCEVVIMIGYVKGTVEGIFDEYILVENQGMGFRIFTSGKALAEIHQLHQEIKLYTYLHVREDELTLYGFPTADELDTFKLLITVNGIGPKVALSILSALSVKDLSLAVMMGDTKTITKANGVGTKGASRLIMELKDKLKFEDVLSLSEEYDAEASTTVSIDSDNISDTVLALVSLGYSEFDAMKAVKQVKGAETMNVDKLLKEALKNIF